MERQELLHILESHSVPLSNWGKGKAKTLDHLLSELNSGEASLLLEKKYLLRLAYGSIVDVFYFTGEEKLKLVEEK